MTTLELKWRNLLDESDFGTCAVTLPATIGRSSRNTLRLRRPNAGISRQHAKIEIDERGLRIHDMGSTNGVFFGTRQVSSGVLPAGGSFVIGAYEITVAPHIQCANANCSKNVAPDLVICPWCGQFLADAKTRFGTNLYTYHLQ